MSIYDFQGCIKEVKPDDIVKEGYVILTVRISTGLVERAYKVFSDIDEMNDFCAGMRGG